MKTRDAPDNSLTSTGRQTKLRQNEKLEHSIKMKTGMTGLNKL